MNQAIVFSDSSAMSEAEWREIRIRDDLFSSGMAELLQVKDKVRPISREAQEYIEEMALRRKVVHSNGDWEL